MNEHLAFRPNLVDCILEDRISPAIANLAVIIQTTSGYVLIESFPGANNSGAGTLGASSSGGGSASSVSGVAIPTALFVTGTNGISSLKPGNITGVPSLGECRASRLRRDCDRGRLGCRHGGRTDECHRNGGATNNVVGPSTVADPAANPTMTVIGGAARDSGSPVLPPGQTYHDNVARAPTGPMNTVPQSATSGPAMSTDPYAPNPQAGPDTRPLQYE